MNAAQTSTRRTVRWFVALAALWTFWTAAATACAADAAAARASIDGPWEGTLKIGAVELRVVFRFARDADGGLTAKMDSPDQGAKDIPIETATRTEDQIVLVARSIGGKFEGALSADGKKISGTWKQSGLAIPLELARLEKEPELRRPQEPQKPYPYDEQQVSYENRANGAKLAGTLTLPRSNTKVPAVLLMSGSGSQDRDETIFGHKPFLVISDYLTRRGIAVLRADDRGVGGSTGDASQSTTSDLAGDALAAVALLKGRPEIDARRIGLVGHSEGALIAALAASRSPDVAFIVMLAGTGVNGEQIILHQGALIARAHGADEKQIAASQQLQRTLFDIVKREPDPAKAEQQIIAATLASEAVTGAADPQIKKAVEQQVAGQVKLLLTPWFRFFLTYDPAATLQKVRCPVLAICGEKDLQVDPEQNLPPIAAALERAGNRDVTIVELPGLNHLFQHCQTGSPVEYAKIDETFSPDALELTADWIAERTK